MCVWHTSITIYRDYIIGASWISYQQMVAGHETIHVVYRKGYGQRTKVVTSLHLYSSSYHMSEASVLEFFFLW